MVIDTVITEPDLTVRQREILKVLVQEYINSAAPVGSNAIQLLGQLGVSSATIRNELATLVELGYVAQPHTSAGRIPTVKGYRYFVQQLMDQVDLPAHEQRMIRHQFHQLRLDLEQWMKLTAAVLAHTAQAASLVTPPHAVRARFKHLELIEVRHMLCLLILVLQDGSVNQEMLVLPTPIEQDLLSQTSNKFNALLQGRTLQGIQDSSAPELVILGDWEVQVLQRIVALMQQADRRAIREVYRDGLVNVLRQPEFDEVDKFRQVLEVLEQRGVLETILARMLNSSGVQIIIGGEGLEQMDDVSLILATYGIKDNATGMLGVIGPTRMPYARAISTVRYVAHLMDSLLTEVYGILQ